MLADLTKLMSDINTTYVSTDAPQQINIPSLIAKRVNTDIKHSTQVVIPGMENIFLNAQEHIERLLQSEVYPRFVKHQMSLSTARALSDSTKRYAGLGDCFCLTDPRYVPLS